MLADLLDWTRIPEAFREELRKGKVEVVQAGKNYGYPQLTEKIHAVLY